MIRWMLFSTLAAGVFYGLYLLLLRDDRQLQLRRCYLMATLAFSLLLPLIKMPDISLQLVDTQPIEMWGAASGAEVVVGGYDGEAPADAARHVPTAIYLAGVALTLATLIVSVLRTFIQIRRLSTLHTGRMRTLLLDDDTAPCSFFRYIIIGTRGMSDAELQCVLAHEREHVRQGHSFDVLLVRLLCCVAWFNPFAWLMLRELRAVHEYQADAAVLTTFSGHTPSPLRGTPPNLGGEPDSYYGSSPKLGEVDAEGGRRSVYLNLLFKQATGFGYGHITNKFNSINIKKRIVMMNKQKSRFGAWKALAVLPVAVALLMVGCKPATTQEPEAVEPQQQEAVATADSVYSVVEQDPEFPGGIEALYKYLAENIKYPEQAKAEGVQGRVFVRFVIEADGSITNAQVLRSIGGGCDEEALRVVNAMPKWKPGMQDGKPVRVQYNLPIIFKLQE